MDLVGVTVPEESRDRCKYTDTVRSYCQHYDALIDKFYTLYLKIHLKLTSRVYPSRNFLPLHGLIQD